MSINSRTAIHTIDLQAGKADLFASIIRWSGVEKDSAVLDVGCSDGRDYFDLLVQTGCNLTGIEYDQNLAERCRRKYAHRSNVTVLQGNAETLDFADESFDMVVCNNMIYLCDKQRVFCQISRVLKRGGVLVCLWNQGIHCYFQAIIHPRPNRTFLLELGRGAYITLNTMLYRCCGIKFCTPTVDTQGELRRIAAKAGLICEKLWLYRWRMSSTLCLLCTKR